MRIAALILSRGRPLKGFSVAAEKTHIHGREALEYSIAVLRRYCERIGVTERCALAGNFEEEEEIYHFLKIANNSPAGPPDCILIHDASRPLIKAESLEAIISALHSGSPAAAVATTVSDTILANGSLFDKGFLIHTPAGFRFSLLLEAHEWRHRTGRRFTSATALIHAWRGMSPQLILQDAPSSRCLESSEDIASLEGVLKFGQPLRRDQPHDLYGTSVLVLGGTGGIGKACIDLLGRLGASYYAPPRQELDLLHEREFADLGSYQAIIHAAGEYKASAETIFGVNFFSCLNLLAAAERMKWHGNIVFLSSSSSTRGRPEIPTYSASKAALNALVEAEADRLATQGIVINAVAPAKVNTRLHDTLYPLLYREAMLSPIHVAKVVVRYLTTRHHGSVAFIRAGMNEDAVD